MTDKQAALDKAVFEGGATRNEKRPMYELIPHAAKDAIASRLELGIASHGRDNWKSGGPEFFAETARHAEWHLTKYMEGCKKDDHLSAAITNLAMLCWWEAEGKQAMTQQIQADPRAVNTDIQNGLVSGMAAGVQRDRENDDRVAALKAACKFQSMESTLSSPLTWDTATALKAACSNDAAKIDSDLRNFRTGMAAALESGKEDVVRQSGKRIHPSTLIIPMLRGTFKSVESIQQTLEERGFHMSLMDVNKVLIEHPQTFNQNYFDYRTGKTSCLWSVIEEDNDAAG